jgi:hypothetical protein
MAMKKSTGVFLGWPRPDFTYLVKSHKNYRSNYNAALLYTHYEMSASDLKKETVRYLRSLDVRHTLIDRARELNENRFSTVGKYCYILNHGGELPDAVQEKLIFAIEKTIEEEEQRQAKQQKNKQDELPEREVKPVISIQDRVKERAREVAGDIEGMIDSFHLDRKTPVPAVDELVGLFKSNDLKAPHVRVIQQSFSRRVEEVALAAEGKDRELAQAYSHFSKPELKKLKQLFDNLLKACEMLQEVAKVARAPRKKKPVSIEKQVAKLKFKKEDTGLGIVSVSPSQILGAREVWVYNTKTRKLGQYKAADVDGIGVKGTSLTNFSADSAEKTLRKPAETLADFKKASKVKLRTFLKDLSTLDTKPNGKLNENHIVLRTDK